jgi:hypothetical protein
MIFNTKLSINRTRFIKHDNQCKEHVESTLKHSGTRMAFINNDNARIFHGNILWISVLDAYFFLQTKKFLEATVLLNQRLNL